MASNYPLPKFHFKVNFGGAEFNCTEVSGLDFETEIVEYRAGADNEYHKSKFPGLKKYSNISVKRGTFADKTKEFYNIWAKTVFFQEKGDEFRGDLTISMLDEAHEPVITWEAKNAFLSKLQSTDLKADGNEVAIETAEFVHEKLVIQ